MTDKMKEFLDAAEQDEALAERLTGAEGPEAVLALAKEKGFELTEADLAVEEATGELSDEALEDVAGGVILNPLGAWTALSSLLLRRFGGRKRQAVNTVFRSNSSNPTLKTMEFNSAAGSPTLTNLAHFSSDEDEGRKLYSL